jgi:hypothetical protein
MYSERFGRDVKITRHAMQRMRTRCITDLELALLVEEGQTRYKDKHRLWVAHGFEGRLDNMLCAPVVLEEKLLVIKTVMHHFSWEG